MTPTKEQKLALTRVVAYMDEMYAIASPYHGCTEDANILRAMIDSSEHIREPPKMVGFDLVARIRELEAENVQLLAALDESERVVAHKTKSAAHWYDEHLQARADRVQTRRVVEQQAARIEELESLVESSMSLVGCHQRVIEKREKALVEERARYIDDFIHEFDPQEDRLDEAREQLRAEGKIGRGDA